jgi:hypothetical protein
MWSSEKKYSDYASLVAKNDRILALTADGDILMIETNPKEFKIIDSIKVSDQPTWAHLALCGNEIFIRELKGIAKFKWSN